MDKWWEIIGGAYGWMNTLGGSQIMDGRNSVSMKLGNFVL